VGESTVGERSKAAEERQFYNKGSYRGKNYKIKLKEFNSFSDHVILYKAWISEW
jgi:hypothetical protein